MTTFLVINMCMFVCHWQLVALTHCPVEKWSLPRKIFQTLFDAIIGVGAATIFYVFAAGCAANWKLLSGAGLSWGAEGRANLHAGEPNEIEIEKSVADEAEAAASKTFSWFSRSEATKSRADLMARQSMNHLASIPQSSEEVEVSKAGDGDEEKAAAGAGSSTSPPRSVSSASSSRQRSMPRTTQPSAGAPDDEAPGSGVVKVEVELTEQDNLANV